MAPERIAFGRLVVAGALAALVVAGCGGSSSSAPATAGDTAASPGSNTSTPASARAPEAPRKASAAGKADGGGKKHPPVSLPTAAPERAPSKAQEARVPTADIAVGLPTPLSAANTCRGKDASPAISWRNVPSGTAELAILAVNVKPVEGKLYFDWAMAGVDPSLTGLEAGEVPEGAVLGRNSAGRAGYSLCPQVTASETYIFSVYALPRSLSPKQGFDPLSLREQATRVSESVGLTAAAFGGR